MIRQDFADSLQRYWQVTHELVGVDWNTAYFHQSEESFVSIIVIEQLLSVRTKHQDELR